ncbi:DUF2461 domain-containing protein [Taibaiella soli]|uniref:DUF2461 domain-containing protein n=1 Tax=Taibaiella soli TaxID=1649169 RepID=A0A2W2B1A9_9BACT|nr:DUF2461 domain-containing protein [Taibaiella soli]PZF73778.1 DUF2461 domain-containing protein [Taibaiella soli]
MQNTTLSFLKNLAANNNKPWFDENRTKYEAAKADHETLIDSLLKQMTSLEPMLEGQKAKDSIFWIFRDVRFSKDKTPYKAHFGAFFSRGGRKYPGAGYYLHIEPGGKSFIGGGLWMPENSLLKAVRQEIDYNFEEFTGIVASKQFKKIFREVTGEQLKTLPQGYSADNPAINYLKMKSFTVSHPLADADVTGKDFDKKSVNVFAVLKPFIDFLNRSLD